MEHSVSIPSLIYKIIFHIFDSMYSVSSISEWRWVWTRVLSPETTQ